MIKRILVGLGGTPFTPAAICYAVELAQVHQTEVPGITVIDRRRQQRQTLLAEETARRNCHARHPTCKRSVVLKPVSGC